MSQDQDAIDDAAHEAFLASQGTSSQDLQDVDDSEWHNEGDDFDPTPGDDE